MNCPELYVLRHGETVWNAEGRMQGILNSPLTEKGVLQARKQGKILARLDLKGFQFLSSPQARAFQTAGIALAGLADRIETDDRLREIGVGLWSGLLRSELVKGEERAQWDGPDGNLALYENAPEGEGFDALELRCRSFLAGLEGPTVLVTHGITSRMIRTIALGLGRSGVKSLPGGQGNVFHVKEGEQTELT